MISHDYKFIFLHIPKTAGLSIIKILDKYNPDEIYYYSHPRIRKYNKVKNKNLNYFVFTFVRNPFSRILSAFNYLKNGGVNIQDRRIRNRYKLDEIDFKTFVKNNIKNDSINTDHFKPQLHYLDYDVKKINFIGKFENLHEDFNTICDKIGIPRQELPHKNKSKHKHYTEYYDDETREIVAEKYAMDIEYFDYRFGE
jgi:hypothetical protein